MYNAFGHEISDSYQAVAIAYEAYRQDQTDARAFALRDAIQTHLRTSPRKGEVCSPLGMLHALARLGYMKLWPIELLVGLLRFHPQLWNIAGWNDFEMAGWLVSRDAFYTARIYRRLYYTKGLVQETCAWMVNSVREQEPEFEKQWSEVNTGFPPQ